MMNEKHNQDKNRQEDQFQQQAWMLDGILSATPNHFYMYDRQGRYLFASQAGARALGMEPDEIIGKTWRELGFPTEIMEPFDVHRQTVFANGQSLTAETHFPTVDGVRIYEYTLNDQQGQVNTVIATVNEITGGAQAESTLRVHATLTAQLASLAEALNYPLSVSEAVVAIGEGALSLSSADRASVFLRLPEDAVNWPWSRGLSPACTTAATSSI